MNHQKWTDVEKVRNWALILYLAMGGHRKIEAGSYCPDACHLSAPLDVENWEKQATHMPKHLEIICPLWKGHQARIEEDPFIIWRNPCDSRFCPVTWILAWLAIAQHPKDSHGKRLGPLFGKLTAQGKTNISRQGQTMLTPAGKTQTVKVSGSTSPEVRVWETAGQQRVNLTDDNVADIVVAVMRAAAVIARRRACEDTECGHANCADLRQSEARLRVSTSHSLRVAFAVWAARMGGERGYVQAKLGGRWELFSAVFDVYWGRGESRRARLRGQRDPLIDKVPWPVHGFTMRDTPDMSTLRMVGRGGGGRRPHGGGGRREGARGRRGVWTTSRPDLQGGVQEA
jgi:hypothetical protein